MNLSWPPFAGGSSSLSGVPARTHVPMSPLASGAGFASGWAFPSPARRRETKATSTARAHVEATTALVNPSLIAESSWDHGVLPMGLGRAGRWAHRLDVRRSERADEDQERMSENSICD